jgi:hypothetical protein
MCGGHKQIKKKKKKRRNNDQLRLGHRMSKCSGLKRPPQQGALVVETTIVNVCKEVGNCEKKKKK